MTEATRAQLIGLSARTEVRVMAVTDDRLERMIGELVIVDMESPYVCLGRLEQITERYLVVADADLHDMRDSDTTRENYIAESIATGIKRNRKRVVILRNQVVAISRLEDFTDL